MSWYASMLLWIAGFCLWLWTLARSVKALRTANARSETPASKPSDGHNRRASELNEASDLGQEPIQIMHEMTVEGYRLTVFKKSGEFVLSWLMDPIEALEMGHLISKTVAQHYEEVIKIVREHGE